MRDIGLQRGGQHDNGLHGNDGLQSDQRTLQHRHLRLQPSRWYLLFSGGGSPRLYLFPVLQVHLYAAIPDTRTHTVAANPVPKQPMEPRTMAVLIHATHQAVEETSRNVDHIQTPARGRWWIR